MSAELTRPLEAPAPEGPRPKRLPRPDAPPAPAFRCARQRCGEPDAGCFHWPGLFIDRSADAAVNAKLAAGPAKAAPAPPPPSTLPALLALEPLPAPALTPAGAAPRKRGRRGR